MPSAIISKLSPEAAEIRRHYWVWAEMRQRCDRATHPQYADYGGRGLTYDPSWISFKAFMFDMGPRPTPKHTLERIDNSAGYFNSNCAWVTRLQNNNNKRRYRNNQLGISGVELTRTGSYSARLRFKGEMILKKTVPDFFEACCLRKSWENKIKEML